MKQFLRKLRGSLRKRRQARKHIPTDIPDAIREGVGPRVVEGPAGLNTNLFDRVLGEDEKDNQ